MRASSRSRRFSSGVFAGGCQRQGLADVIRHAHAVQSRVEAEDVALLREHAHDDRGSANGLLTRFTAFPAFGLSGVQRGGAPCPAIEAIRAAYMTKRRPTLGDNAGRMNRHPCENGDA